MPHEMTAALTLLLRDEVRELRRVVEERLAPPPSE